MLYVLVGAGCGGQPTPQPRSAADERPAPPPPAAERPKEKLPAPNPLFVKTEDGRPALSRQALKDLQMRGAQMFIQGVRVRAIHGARGFGGWQVLHYAGPGRLLAGDVIISVNGSTLERPAQFMQVWNELSRRDSLVIVLSRKGVTAVLNYPIVEP